MLRNYGSGIGDVIRCLAPLAGEPEAGLAFEALREDFLLHDAIGPRRVAEFLQGSPDDAVQADVVGLVQQVLRAFSGQKL